MKEQFTNEELSDIELAVNKIVIESELIYLSSSRFSQKKKKSKETMIRFNELLEKVRKL